MTAGSDWYQNEQALLTTVREATRLFPCTPSIPGYDGLRELGRGGQGVVFEAVQRSTKRNVAIKLLLEGVWASETSRRRFEREVDLIVALQHPNIVRVYDSGVTADARPYYVMEYIAGVSLDELIRSAAAPTDDGQSAAPARKPASPDAPRFVKPRPAIPSIPAALSLFAKICDAVNYAHQRGVIHRDLKPSNIRIDPAGEPHVLDFGLAKSATQVPAPAEGSQMSVAGQFMGSLPWASPEQAEGVPSRVDVRTDVYSLGVLLYQLLTGGFPYPVAGPFPEVINRIRHTPPLRPSVVRPEINDELDTIVLKALAKEPERRYQSAGELARDIRRYLAGEPIEAKRDSAWYTVRKTLRRYRLAAGVASSFLVLAVGVASTTSVLYSRASRAEQVAEERRAQAETEADKARRTQRFLQNMFDALDPTKARGRDVALLHELLDEAAKRVEVELAAQPEIEAPVRVTIGRTYRSLGDFAAAESQLDAALQFYRRLGGDSLETLQVISDLAGVYQDRGRFADAEPRAREALEGFRRLRGENHRDTLTAQNNLAFLLENLGRIEQAEALYRQTLAARRRVLGEDHLDTINSKGNLAQLLLDRGAIDEAAPLIRETLDARRRLLGPDHPDTVTSVNNAARLAQEQGRFDEAEQLYQAAVQGYRRALGEAHPRTLTAMSNLAVVYKQLGRLTEAETLLRAALDLQRRTLKDEDPAAAPLLNNLARALQDNGRPAEAEPLLRRVFETLQTAYGEEHPQTLNAQNNLAGVLADVGRRDEAIALFRRCVEIRRRTLGPEHPQTLLAGINWASNLRDAGQLDEALSLFEDLTKAAGALPSEHWLLPFLKGGHGETLTLLKRYAEAEPLLLDSLKAFQATRGDENPATRRAAMRLLNLYTAWGQPDRAARYVPEKP